MNRHPAAFSTSAQGGIDLASTEKFCVFQRASATFGVLASVVREVALQPSVTFVPDADPLLAGICHIRNEFLPVIRLSEFSVRKEISVGEQQIIVISSANGPWALLVDRVIGLLPLEVSLCSDVGASHGWSAAVMGSATYRNQIVQVLDANALLRLAEDVLSRYWRGEVSV
jgi:purine-binding chemotaxis protein CheW